MRRFARSWLAVATAAAVAVSSTLGAMVLASRSGLPDPGDISIGLGRLLLQRNVPLRFAPLSARLLVGSLGPGLLERASGDGGRPPRPGRGDHEPPGEGDPEEDPPLPEQLTSEPRLVIGMRVSQAQAGPGDRLTYTITFRNDGRGRAHDVRITAHVPPHTTFLGDECGRIVRVNPKGGSNGLPQLFVCVPLPVVLPGEHAWTAGYEGVGPGDSYTISFRVVVNADAPPGYRIRNHAHISAVGTPVVTSAEVTTIVR